MAAELRTVCQQYFSNCGDEVLAVTDQDSPRYNKNQVVRPLSFSPMSQDNDNTQPLADDDIDATQAWDDVASEPLRKLSFRQIDGDLRHVLNPGDTRTIGRTPTNPSDDRNPNKWISLPAADVFMSRRHAAVSRDIDTGEVQIERLAPAPAMYVSVHGAEDETQLDHELKCTEAWYQLFANMLL